MPIILILYHYYSPDDVVSAVQFTGLAEGLTERGFEVEVWPSNRACHDPDKTYGLKVEMVKSVKVRRVWRPAFSQHSFLGRILNSIWMQKAWWLRLLFHPSIKPDLILIGTDPLLSLLCVPFLKFLRPKAKVAHWCFDLYPEAAVADNILGEKSKWTKVIKFFMKKGYQSCDLVVDLGPCMKERLQKYGFQSVTLTPWALEEPGAEPTSVASTGSGNSARHTQGSSLGLRTSGQGPLAIDPQERAELFGDTNLGLLYSGSFGRAHEFYLTLKIARLMGSSAVFAYSVRGSRLAELKLAVNPEDTNFRFVDFAPQDRLAARLSAPDVHLVSLRPDWSGTVVPSKFFGALAIGRPILFEGDENSSIARWIREYQVGWVLHADNLGEIVQELGQFAKSPKAKAAMFQHCHDIYQAHFSKKAVVDKWNSELQRLLAR